MTETHTIRVEDGYAPKSRNSKEITTREIVERAYRMAGDFIARNKRAATVSDVKVVEFTHEMSRVFVGLRATLTITYTEVDR